MPKIAFFRNLVFFLYAYDLTERYHLHISKSKKGRTRSAKIWLDTVDVFEKGDLTEKELKQCQQVIIKHKEAILEQIRIFAEGKRVNLLDLSNK